MAFIDPALPAIRELIKSEDKKKKNVRMEQDGMYGEGPLEDPQDLLSRAIKKAKPAVLLKVIEANQIQRAMIFCRTRLDCDHLEEYLKANLGAMGRDELCVTLHSDKSVEQRKQVVDNFKGDKVNFFICTDIAARGIDVSGLPFVISMPLPRPFTCFLQFICHLFLLQITHFQNTPAITFTGLDALAGQTEWGWLSLWLGAAANGSGFIPAPTRARTARTPGSRRKGAAPCGRLRRTSFL